MSGPADARYRAAREHAGILHRADLAVLRMSGRDPVRMLQGLITNDLAGAPPGRGVLAAMLTPKGRMIAELRALARDAEEGREVVAIVPRAALEGTMAHLKKFVPPMFARCEDLSERRAIVGVYGPESRAAVAAATGADIPELDPEAFAEIDVDGATVIALATDYAGVPGHDLLLPADAAPAVTAALLRAPRTREIGPETLETLRVEAGRPRYGSELTEETIPPEAYESIGLLERVVSFTKGCYTGQEVIVRIAHRGHVNRQLRGLRLGSASPPPSRTLLHHPETGKEVGWTTTAVESPRVGMTIALAYVRREVAPGDTVRVGDQTATVTALPFAPP